MRDFNILVTSVPKCGTYLGGAFVKAAGFVDQELHVYNLAAEDYRGLDEDKKILKPVNTFSFDLISHLRWSKPGSFVVGHPGFTKDLKEYLQNERNTKVIYVSRDLRIACISQIKFLHRAENIHDYVKKEPFWSMEMGPEKIKSFLCSRAFHDWFSYAQVMQPVWPGADVLDNVFSVKYNDLKAEAPTALVNFLEVEFYDDYLGVQTRTYDPKGETSEELFAKHWSLDHQYLWEIIGGPALNKEYE